MKFDYSFAEISQDKRVRRTEVVDPSKMPEVVGTDMRIAGGLTPHPGFKKVRTLTGFNVNSSNSTEVVEFYPFSVVKATDQKVHGFVYRVKGASTSSYKIDWYDGTWTSETLKPGVANASATPWSIVTVGRLLYLYIKGVRPILWYIDPDTGNSVTNEETGPGVPPAAPDVLLSFNSWDELQNSGDPIPITEFPYVPEGTTGPITDETPGLVDFDDNDILIPSNYNFAYQYINSTTGLVSNLSNVTTVDESRFIERVPFDRGMDADGNDIINYRSVGVMQGWSVTIPADPRFDQAKIFRSTGIVGVGSNAISSILYLEKYITDGLGLGHTGELRDAGIVLKETFDQATLYDAEPPYGGVAYNFGESVFVSSIGGSGTVDGFREIGEVRWSSLSDIGPELFPPGNRYVPEEPSDDIICWFEVADVLHGASRDKIFDCDRTGRYAVFRRMYRGYGAVSQGAAVEYGPATLLVTPQGVKEIRPDGEMLNINAFNLVILDEWKASLSSVVAVRDTPMGVIMILNTTEQKSLCLWTETRQVSELWYVPFAYAGEGVDPESGTTEKRALFVTPQGVVYRLDHKGEKTFTNHPDTTKNNSTYKAMLEIDGEHFLQANGAPSGNTITVEDPDGESIELDDVRDAWCYFPTQDEWCQIEYGESGSALTRDIEFKTTPPSVSAGDRILLAPVMVKVMGHPMGRPVSTDGRTFVPPTRWTMTTAATIGCFFEGVDGVGLDEAEATFKGRLYLGLTTTAATSATPKDSSGTATNAIGSSGGPSIFARFDTYGLKDQLILPSVEVVCPDIDFVLLGMRIEGTMVESSENTRT